MPSQGTPEWLPFLAARSLNSVSSKSVSDVLTSELLQDFQSSPKKTPSNLKHAAAKKDTPPISRLDEGTDLLVSIAMSIPYYNMSNYSHSLDTVNLLQSANDLGATRNESNSDKLTGTGPAYANTLHISGRDVAMSKEAVMDVTLNQVPPRFSQFIVDQNEVATVTSTVPHRNSITISELMGSQATIFSTREQSGGVHRKRSRHRIPAPSVPQLSRRLAIRIKEGGLLYRLKIRMRRVMAATKQKGRRMLAYVVGSRHKSVQRRRTKGRVTISAPLANPTLGKGSALRVPELTGALKNMAGYQDDNAATQPIQGHIAEYDGKMSHLTNYISEQRQLSAAPESDAFLIESAAPPPPPHKDSQFEMERQRVHTLWRQYLANVLAQRILLRQEISVFQALSAGTHVARLGATDAVSSHRMSFAQSQRVSLAFSGYSEDKNIISRKQSVRSLPEPNIGNTPRLGSSPENPLAPSELGLLDWETQSSMLLVSVSDSLFSVESVDPTVQKLHRVLNRRSVLGDMLDYDSDERELVFSSGLEDSDPDLQRYGTVRRSTPTASSKYLDISLRLMPRSFGISQELNLFGANQNLVRGH